MKKLFQSNIITALVLFAAAVLVSIAVYPEVFISSKMSVVIWSDYCVEYAPTFILTTFLYQGGLQLWDFFAQMPYFHTYAVLGLFKFPNVVTAISYYLLAPFTEDSSHLFHQVFIWGYLMTLLFLRVTGIFLLLKTVTKNRPFLSAGTVLFAVFFSQMAFLRGTPYMSYFPLGMYFVVRLFQDLQLRFLVALFFFFMIVLSTELLHGAYLYLPMHFFIIAGILWRVFFKPAVDRPFWTYWRWKDMAWAILAAALMMAPYLFIMKFSLNDLAFGQDNSRIAHPFSPQWYFQNPQLDLGSPGTFFGALLNIQKVDALFYVGLSFLFLALAGFILNRHKLKWFFALGVFFLWLLSFPREGIHLGLIAHWVNVLTNPLKALPRSYRFTCEGMLPYLLMPLAVMGIEAMVELFKGKKYPAAALGSLAGMTFLLVLNGIFIVPPEVSAYLIACGLLLIGGIARVHFRNSPRARSFLVGTICFLAVIDICFIIYQSKHTFERFCYRKPTILDAAPQAGVVEYDYENPSIFPYRNSYTFHFSYNDELDIWFPHGLSSDLHHVINQALNFTFLNGYNPRHKEFAKWLNDPQMLTYLTQNNEFIFLAQSAIKASPGALGRICSAGLARQVVTVEDPKGNLNLADQWPGSITPKPQEDLQYSQVAGTIDDNTQPNQYLQTGGMIIYTLYLPSDFPGHLASSWFPAEQRYLRFFVEGEGGQWRELQAAQGELIRPYTFDVQNIKQGELKAAFSKNDFPMHHKCVLFYPSSENQGVEKVWRKQFDNLGTIYRAKRDGWWVGHYPYDPKWRISVDGKPVPYYRVDKSFIGFPLGRGEHKILVQYWPHSPLRIFLFISALLTTLGLPLLIFLALKWENK